MFLGGEGLGFGLFFFLQFLLPGLLKGACINCPDLIMYKILSTSVRKCKVAF